MLYDRPYMREDPLGRRTSPVTWLLCAVIAGFILQLALGSWFGAEEAFVGQLAVTGHALRLGHLWTLVSYGLVHDPFNLASGLLDTVCCLIALYFLGRELVPLVGNRRFWWIAVGALVAGGLAWSAVNWRRSGSFLCGPTAIADAFLVVYACFYPNEELNFLLLFLIPVRLKPKFIALAVALYDLCGFSFFEVLGRASPFGGQHSAHLAGLAAGWAYYRFAHKAEWRLFRRRAATVVPIWSKAAARGARASTGLAAAPAKRDNLKAEVDRILDKINSDGFGALTPEEKRILDEARDLLSRR